MIQAACGQLPQSVDLVDGFMAVYGRKGLRKAKGRPLALLELTTSLQEGILCPYPLHLPAQAALMSVLEGVIVLYMYIDVLLGMHARCQYRGRMRALQPWTPNPLASLYACMPQGCGGGGQRAGSSSY